MRHLWALCLLCIGFAAQAGPGELRIVFGVQDALPAAVSTPGQGTPQSGGLVLFNEDVAREICRRLNTRCHFSNASFAEILPAVERGQFDLGFGNFLRTPAREQRVAFTDSLWRSVSRLLTKPENAAAYRARLGEPTIDSLREARVGVIAESSQQAYLQSVAAERKLTVVPAKTMLELLELLRQGKVDFNLMVMLSAYTMLGREAAGTFEFVGEPLSAHGLGGTVHAVLPKADETLRQSVNQALAAMRADGSYVRIMRRHFPFSLD